ncbi:MAG: hypothetical protein IJ192_10435 [Clostridia bacterium]|nr:hypothetical protein [Clostridia bacterium]
MADKNTNESSELLAQTFKALQTDGEFDIKPCNITNIEDNPKFKKLNLTSGQKMQMSAFAGQIPAMVAAFNSASALSAVSNSTFYIMELPNGLPYTLTKLGQGGFSNTLRGSDGFVKQLSLYPIDLAKQLTVQTIALGTFSVMSVATGQYFLSQINSKLDRIKLGMDKILEFLYGDKKAELMAEVIFTKYAFNNYSAIMEQECQRIATISGLQQARKVAMKDSEFYISDLETTITEKNDIVSTVNKALQIEESLALALQLCVMSSILEVQYSQNFDDAYLKYIEDDILLYIDKCEKIVLGNFNKLQILIDHANAGIWKKVNKDELQCKIVKVLDKFQVGAESQLKQSLRSGLHISDKKSVYYINKDGTVYIKSA